MDEEVIDVTGRCQPGQIVLEVSGPGELVDPALLAAGLPGSDAETGRGLAIVASLMDKVEQERHDGSTAMRATKSVRALRLVENPGVR
jgi:anti-sigma regulatory factor (Ser/Thr protein kinase)